MLSTDLSWVWNFVLVCPAAFACNCTAIMRWVPLRKEEAIQVYRWISDTIWFSFMLGRLFRPQLEDLRKDAGCTLCQMDLLCCHVVAFCAHITWYSRVRDHNRWENRTDEERAIDVVRTSHAHPFRGKDPKVTRQKALVLVLIANRTAATCSYPDYPINTPQHKHNETVL